jgi:hypothetical protein
VWLAVDGRPPTEVDEVAIRVLGVRHVAQGLFQAVLPLRLDPLFVAVDLVHAATMVPLVLGDDRRRRPAIVTASAALATAGLTVAARRRRR